MFPHRFVLLKLCRKEIYRRGVSVGAVSEMLFDLGGLA
jgi:hypothetical protein